MASNIDASLIKNAEGKVDVELLRKQLATAKTEITAGQNAHLNHLQAADPHPQYLTQQEADAVFVTPAQLTTANTGVLTAAATASAAGDANHLQAADPHPQYLTQQEADAIFVTPAQLSTAQAAALASADDYKKTTNTINFTNLSATPYVPGRYLVDSSGGSFTIPLAQVVGKWEFINHKSTWKTNNVSLGSASQQTRDATGALISLPMVLDTDGINVTLLNTAGTNIYEPAIHRRQNISGIADVPGLQSALDNKLSASSTQKTLLKYNDLQLLFAGNGNWTTTTGRLVMTNAVWYLPPPAQVFEVFLSASGIATAGKYYCKFFDASTIDVFTNLSCTISLSSTIGAYARNSDVTADIFTLPANTMSNTGEVIFSGTFNTNNTTTTNIRQAAVYFGYPTAPITFNCMYITGSFFSAVTQSVIKRLSVNEAVGYGYLNYLGYGYSNAAGNRSYSSNIYNNSDQKIGIRLSGFTSNNDWVILERYTIEVVK